MSLKGTQTEKNLLTAFAGESQARNRYTYYASQALTWKLFFQVNSALKKTNVHLMCLYNLLPLGTIQVVYQKGTAAFGVKGTQDHTLFLRLNHTF